MPYVGGPAPAINLGGFPNAHGVPHKVTARDASYAKTIRLTQSADQKLGTPGDKMMLVEQFESPTITGSPQVTELRHVASAVALATHLESNSFEK